jgi:hypothetical protein
LRKTQVNKPIIISKNPTGKVPSINQMYAPEPLPSSHIDTPLARENKNASNKGEKAKRIPTRINGNALILLPILLLY